MTYAGRLTDGPAHIGTNPPPRFKRVPQDLPI